MALRKKFLSMLLALSLVLSMVGVASADLGTSAQEAAYARMSALKLAAGVRLNDGTVVPALEQELTRAQMVTIIVRAFGREQEAQLLTGVTLYPDVPASHWASGYITVAKKLGDEKGITIGRPGGTFDPDANVTAAEVLAFVMKFLNVSPALGQTWPNDYIQGGLSAGLISSQDADLLTMIGGNKATRGLAFALSDGIFYGYKGLPGDKSVYTTYADDEPPTITLTGSLPTSTEEEALPVFGSVDADVVLLTLGNRPVTIAANGSFSVALELAVGENEFVLRAEDLAGNVTTKDLSVARTEPEPEHVGPQIAEVTADKEIAATFERVQMTALDENGEPITEGVTWSVDDVNGIVTNAGLFQSPVAGTYLVRAQLGNSTSFMPIRIYGAPVKLKIEASDTVANSVSKKPLSVIALDEHNTPVLNFGANEERVTLTGFGVEIFDEHGNEATEVTAKDGAAKFQITVDSAMAGESFILTATYGEGDDEIIEEAEFDALEPIAAGVKAEGPAFIAANTGTSTPEGAIKVWVVDQDGAPVFDGYEVTATITGPADLLDEVDVYGSEDSPAHFRISNYNHVGMQGKVVLRFSVDGVGSTTLTINQVIAGSPAKLEVKPEKKSYKATDLMTFTATVQDSNGVPVPVRTDTELVVKLADNLTDKFSVDEETIEILEGDMSATFTMEAIDAFLGDLEVKVQSATGSLVGRGTVAIEAGTVDSVGFDRKVALVPLIAPQATFHGFLADELGNPVVVPNYSLEVYVQEVDNTDATTGENTSRVTINGRTTTDTKPITVRTNSQGEVELKLVATPQNDKIYMVRLRDKENGEDGYAYLQLVNTVPGELKVLIYKELTEGNYHSTTTVTAGQRFWVKVSVTDNYGGPVEGIAEDLKIVSDDVFSMNGIALTDSENFEFEDWTWWETHHPDIAEELDLVDGDYVAEVYGGKEGTQAVKVAYNLTVNDVTGSRNVTVKAGEFNGVAANDGKEITVKANSVTGPYTIALVDHFGNTASSNLTQEITWYVEDEDGDDANSRVNLRTSASAGTVSHLSTKGSTRFYLDVNSTGTYTVTFYAGSYSGTLTVIVQK